MLFLVLKSLPLLLVHLCKHCRGCLFTLILIILVILICQNSQNIYFVKYSFLFQHIQNGQFNYSKLSFSYSKKSFQIFFISQNIILISNLTILNVFIQTLILIPTHLKWSTQITHSKCEWPQMCFLNRP